MTIVRPLEEVEVIPHRLRFYLLYSKTVDTESRFIKDGNNFEMLSQYHFM